MAGYQILTPTAGSTDWTSADTQREKQRKGFIALSFGGWDTTDDPVINAGSVVEMGGSLFQFLSTESVGGTITTSNPNYIYITSSSSSLTASATSTAPTWSGAKQGYYDAGGTKRCIGGCWKDRSRKWIYTNRYAGPNSRTLNIPWAGYTHDLSKVVMQGAYLDVTAPSNDDYAFFEVQLPQYSIVTSLKSYIAVSQYVSGTHTFSLFRTGYNSQTPSAMATVSHNSTGEVEDTSIATPLIDNDNYKYYVKYSGTTDAIANICGLQITYDEIIRC